MKYMDFDSPIGKIFITANNGEIFEIGLVKEKLKHLNTENTPVLEEAKEQILEYFAGKRRVFDLPINFVGTNFQKKVWQQLQKIPYGTTWSYKELAKAAESEKAVRAVGNANNKNNFLIVVPCHRVIGSNGKLVGYAEGLEIKQYLLNLENDNI